MTPTCPLRRVFNAHRKRLMEEQVKSWLDATSIAIVLGTIAQWLPAIAALASLIWTGIRIYETKTVQGWLGKGRR